MRKMFQVQVYHYVNATEKMLYQGLKGIKDVDVRQDVMKVEKEVDVNAVEKEIFVTLNATIV